MQPTIREISNKQNLTHVETLAGRHALVTGGSRGIGATISEKLVQLGANLTLAARDEERLNQHRENLRQLGSSAINIQLMDLNNPESITQSHIAARNELGPVTILINNAGIAPSAPLAELELASWQDTYAINAQAAFFYRRSSPICTIKNLAGW